MVGWQSLVCSASIVCRLMWRSSCRAVLYCAAAAAEIERWVAVGGGSGAVGRDTRLLAVARLLVRLYTVYGCWAVDARCGSIANVRALK